MVFSTGPSPAGASAAIFSARKRSSALRYHPVHSVSGTATQGLGQSGSFRPSSARSLTVVLDGCHVRREFPDFRVRHFRCHRHYGVGDASPDEGLIEDLMVEDRAVEQLAEGLLSHYLPDLQRSKQALQELTQNQVVLLDTLEQEISKFKECHSMLDINALFTEAKHYHAKLVSIRRDMLLLHEKTSKLKATLKLQQKRQKEELEREQQREKEFEREKQLTAKPAKRA
ncbi:Pallidin [Fukomys damarensis]|uniref:Pallidin n=1 Tax=Fukomys damarensis TaxID=885580 RepID=A0A091DC43_FUKDA|nr:Pallidin [Fukomys damarensis]